MNRPIILIPSYNPDEALPETVARLRAEGFEQFVIVDDGSRTDCTPVFEEVCGIPGVHLLKHAVNLGKGRGMKTGFNYIFRTFPGAGCIVCDADGQHPVESACDVADAMDRYPDALVLGVRRFTENKKMPKANLVGNQLTRATFFLLSGIRYADTQCGLRGYPAGVMEKILTCQGERFEYENTMLMETRRLGIRIVQVGMPAIYQEEGKYKSHFNKLKDSVRIYKVLLAYAAQPMLCAAATFAVFLVLLYLLPDGYLWNLSAAAAGYLLGWLTLVPGIGKRKTGWAFLAAAGLSAGYTGVFALLSLGLPSAPAGCWWILALPTAVLTYTVWLRLREGPLPENIRLDR